MYVKAGYIRVIYNETGYNNYETFGKWILPFWFKKEADPSNILVTLDGAGCHTDLNKILEYA